MSGRHASVEADGIEADGSPASPVTVAPATIEQHTPQLATRIDADPLASAAAPTSPAASASSSTLTVRAFGKKASFWVVIAIIAIVISVIAALIAGGATASGVPLGATNPSPTGSMAVVEVLRNQGVTVTVADTLDQASAAVAKNPDSAVFFSDPNAYLSADQLATLGARAPRLVIAAPGFLALETLAPAVGFGGVSNVAAEDSETLTAACALPAAERAGSISPGGNTLSLAGAGAAASAYVGCFPSSDDRFSVIRGNSAVAATTTLTLVAPTEVFDNEHIVEYGNAALSLGLLGESDSLIWYLPTIADLPVTGPPSLGELTPGWVTPALLLLVVTALGAFIWRGRRFGPLVAENLPVTVIASETMEGRARLYARNSARLRAADSLRVGTVRRLASVVGLSRTASLDDVIATVAALTGRAPTDIGSLLVGSAPATDRELITLSDRLLELENLTTRLTDPNHALDQDKNASPPGRMDP
ncbi:DUF4350 domain-containing protein [Leifsonia sp. A12D58]|uniref:DUF4350 domain-containing protein n=1 Tax=Leifsonia sp. A12D58 TaxID=3397674 RepID=UPI0039E17138